jgi:hypothetical protein
LSRLETLSLSRTRKITASGVRALQTLLRLERLDMSSGKFGDDVVNEVAEIRSLERLSLNGCRQVGDGSMNALATLPGLEDLRLEGCAVTDEGLRRLTKAPRLKFLDLSRTNAISPDGVATLRDLSTLEQIALNDCHRIGEEEIEGLRKALPGCKLSRLRPWIYVPKASKM